MIMDASRGRVVMTPGRSMRTDTRSLMMQYSIADDAWSVNGALPSHVQFFEGRGAYQPPSDVDDAAAPVFAIVAGGQDLSLGIVSQLVWRIDVNVPDGGAALWSVLTAVPHPGFGFAVINASPPPGPRNAPKSNRGSKRVGVDAGTTANSDSDSKLLSVFLIGGSVSAGPYCTSDAWEMVIPTTPNTAVTSSTLTLPLCVPINGCNRNATLLADAKAVADDWGIPDRVSVVSAWYGPYLVTRPVQVCSILRVTATARL